MQNTLQRNYNRSIYKNKFTVKIIIQFEMALKLINIRSDLLGKCNEVNHMSYKVSYIYQTMHAACYEKQTFKRLTPSKNN